MLKTVFPLDSEGIHKPWAVLANYFAPRYVTKKFGPEGVGWERIYERRIEKIINRLDPDDIKDIPIRVQTVDQLAEFCKIRNIYVNPYEFHDVATARRMVQLRLDDEGAYEKHLAEYRQGQHRQMPELDRIKSDERIYEADFTDEFEKADTAPQKQKPKNRLKQPAKATKPDSGTQTPKKQEKASETPKSERKRPTENPFEKV